MDVPRITIDDEGRAWLADEQVRVVQVILDYLAHGWSPEEIHRQHSHLSLAQIHSAFAYYYDHQAELDQQIAEELVAVRMLRSQTENPELQQRLREQRERRSQA